VVVVRRDGGQIDDALLKILEESPWPLCFSNIQLRSRLSYKSFWLHFQRLIDEGYVACVPGERTWDVKYVRTPKQFH
jgi:DNA-binding IclR family transcriptional regulator